MFVTYGSYRVNCRGQSARGRVALSTKCGCDLEVPVLKEQFVELIQHKIWTKLTYLGEEGFDGVA